MEHLELLHSSVRLVVVLTWQALASLLLERDYFG